MFDNKHRREYFYDLLTVITSVLPDELCDGLANRVQQVIAEDGVDLVEHRDLGLMRCQTWVANTNTTF